MSYDRETLLDMYRNRVDSYDGAPHGYRQDWSRWCQHLLDYGGDLVVPHLDADEHLELLLNGSECFDTTVTLTLGAPSQCHANTAALWAQGDVETIVTGYALSGDGLWRQHSWGLHADGHLVETTEMRDCYVGVRLDGMEAMRFALGNAEEALYAVVARRGPRAEALLTEMARLIN